MEARKFFLCGWLVYVQMLLKLDLEKGNQFKNGSRKEKCENL